MKKKLALFDIIFVRLSSNIYEMVETLMEKNVWALKYGGPKMFLFYQNFTSVLFPMQFLCLKKIVIDKLEMKKNNE